MTNEEALMLINRAANRDFISPGQADSIKEELSMYPGGNVVSILVRRGMLTPEQAKILEDEADDPAISSEPTAADEADLNFGYEGAIPDFEIISGPAATRNTSNPLSHTYKAPLKSSSDRTLITPGTESNRSGLPAKQGKSLNITTTETAPDPQMVRFLMTGRERGASDLHLTVGKPPYLRHEGQIYFLEEQPLTTDAAQRLNLSVLTVEQRKEFEVEHQVDFSFGCAGAGRFRANVYRQRTGVEGAYRFISEEVPTFSSLGLPQVLEKLTLYPQGLNLVTGPGGCGKTTTVAAMLEYINCHRTDHIITVEDPVEYVFQPKNCQITQRQVGTHTESFAHALRTALRQDPDVIMIGELRDLETTSISITAAETGHLVFGTLHTSSAVRTVARILDVYPPAQRAQICMMVAESLRGIVSQQLIPRKDGADRVCAMEILLITTGVAQVIKEGKTHQLVSHMQSGRKLGMISMDDALLELQQAGLISEPEAYNRAENKSMFMLRQS